MSTDRRVSVAKAGLETARELPPTGFLICVSAYVKLHPTFVTVVRLTTSAVCVFRKRSSWPCGV